MIGLFLTSLTACEEDLPQVTNDHEFGDCSILDIAENASINNCKTYNGPDTIHCQEIREEIFRLSFDDQLWLPYYCCEIDEEIIYVDASGTELSLTVLEKSHKLISTSIYYNSEQCLTDTTQRQSYCITYTHAAVSLSLPIELDSTTNNPLIKTGIHINLNIDVFINPLDPIEPNKICTGSLLNIKTNTINNNSSSIQKSIFRHTIDQGTLPNYCLYNPVFHESIELVGRIFQNVYTFDNTEAERKMTIYYSQDLGIVSFIDGLTGIQWRLSDEYQ